MSDKPEKSDKPMSRIQLIEEARRLGCNGCAYFSIADPADHYGQCRRSAPTRDASKAVAKEYWCGEFFPLRQA
jgi:hypothetical protein